MEQEKHSQQFLRKRKILMMMPLLILPFITLIFWAFGGGKVTDADEQPAQEGLNMQLPDANLKEDKLDKLNYYEKAASASAKVLELMKKDPYYKSGEETDTSVSSLMKIKQNIYKDSYLNRSTYNNSSYSDPNEAKVYNKLTQLNTALNNAATPKAKQEGYENDFQPANTTNINTSDVDRSEQMMQTRNQKNGDDPEMQQLNGMLEKILQIQHPDR